MERGQVLVDIVREIVAQIAEVPLGEVSADSRIGSDLGIGGPPCGSGEFLDLKEALEDRFQIHIPEGEILSPEEARDLTVGQVADSIKMLVEGNA